MSHLWTVQEYLDKDSVLELWKQYLQEEILGSRLHGFHGILMTRRWK